MPICPVCGEDEPLNTEDVFPQWLRKHATSRSGGTNFTGTVNDRPYDAPVPFSVRVRLGEPCNRWMGRTFESPAKPILVPLIDGWRQTLLPAAQEIVARWIAKTAVIDALGRPERPADEVYREFRRTGCPPIGSRIHLGWYSPSTSAPPGRQRFVKPTHLAGPTRVSFLPLVQVVGQLVIVYSLSVEGPPVRTVAERRNALTRIWPPPGRPVEWPPPGSDAETARDAMTWEVVP